ncbi:GtrA family protein [Granulicoccus phenolivorans]|uniref:GtrA family protein n=1 Tax=Granulicoccus phenolivorans TaxID=266854 RepID=UPI001FE14ED3|nr:GtrA family protein [Granulicoccus phenolivorans]
MHASDPDADQTEPEQQNKQPHIGLFTQLFRFVMTGGLSAIVDFGTLLLLTNLVPWPGGGHVPDNLAKTVSFILGTSTAYAINRRWTFRAAPSTRRLVMVWASYGLTFILQVGLYALTRPVLFGYLPENWARAVSFVIAQGAATTCNFVIQRYVIFRSH